MNTSDNKALLSASISWTPLVRGGHNYKAHELIVESEHQLTIKATPLHFLILTVFIGMSLFFVFITSPKLLYLMDGDIFSALFPVVSLVIFSIGCVQMHKAIKHNKTFDRLSGQYTDNKVDTTKMADKVLLSDIHGLQIIDELVRSQNSQHQTTFVSYELNLVMSDGKRINVMDHGHKKSIISDAQTLSKFLNIPILSQF